MDELVDICNAMGVETTSNMPYLLEKIKRLRTGSIRYDRVRHLNAEDFYKIFKHNVQGSRFDDFVDKM